MTKPGIIEFNDVAAPRKLAPNEVLLKIQKIGRLCIWYGWCGGGAYGGSNNIVQDEPPLTLCTDRLSLYLKLNGRRCYHERVCNLHKS